MPVVSSTAQSTSSSEAIDCWPGLGDQLLDGQALAPQVALEHAPVLDEHDRLALEHRAQGAERGSRCRRSPRSGPDREDRQEAPVSE